jgi:hypothetical protein
MMIFTSPTFDSNKRLPLALSLTPFSHCGYVSESYRPLAAKARIPRRLSGLEPTEEGVHRFL